ncbi:SDR family oxidoreductase [Dyella ginsengisoli]|uniref:SDR family oxidoreductase n=2 Tax=Dyella ginsengisoli TaxID=363848 RepID=A0ABW8JTG5_9GAMM
MQCTRRSPRRRLCWGGETGLSCEISAPGSEGELRYSPLVLMSRFGKPDEIAAAIAFLGSDDAACITGQTVFVDGGASIGKAPV